MTRQVQPVPNPCPSGKLGFNSHRHARRYLKNAKLKIGVQDAYPCYRCGFWHLTSQEKAATRAQDGGRPACSRQGAGHMTGSSPEPRRRSPRTKLYDDTVLNTLVNGLKAGLYREEAAIGAGISVSTFYRWMKEGEAHHHAELTAAAQNTDNPDWEPPEQTRQRVVWEAVKEAEATAELGMVALVRKAAFDGTWQAAAWWLERKMPTKWGRKDRLEHTGEVAAGEPKVVAPASDAERLSIARILDDAGALHVEEDTDDNT